MTPQQIREFARIGALDVARRAVVEFPDILPELNKLANGNGNGARRPRIVDLAEAVAFKIAAEPTDTPARRRSKISAAGRRAISRAMKLRWQKAKAKGTRPNV